MNAFEARKLSEEKQISTEQALAQIEGVAGYGNTSISFSNIGKNSVMELMELGYKLTIHKDQSNGIEWYVCTW